jgi:guanylate kinase
VPLSSETQNRLNALVELQASFDPNETIKRALGLKTLTMLVGPSQIGKSTSLRLAEEMAPGFVRIPSFTTRSRLPRDTDGLYRYVNHNDDNEMKNLISSIEERNIVQFVIHPETKSLYGSDLADYKDEHALVDTLYNNVEQMRRVGFGKTVTAALVAQPEEWLSRFINAYPLSNEEHIKRLREGTQSLTWMLDQDEESLFWIQSKKANVQATSQRIVDITLNDSESTNGGLRVLAEGMLKRIRELS